MPTLGHNVKGVVGSGNWTADIVYVTKFTCVGNGNVTALKMYVKQWAAGTPKMKWCIYADAGDGTPGALLDVTNEWTLTGGYDDWKEIALAGGPLAVTDGTIYHLGWNSDGVATYYWDASGANNFSLGASVYPAFPNPNNNNPVVDRKVSIYGVFAAGVSIPVMMHHYNRIYKKIRG